MSKYRISGVPICDEAGRLVGIITNRDIRFLTEYTMKISEVMTKDNLVTAPVGTTLEQAKVICASIKLKKLPLVDENLMLRGLITIKDIEKATLSPLGQRCQRQAHFGTRDRRDGRSSRARGGLFEVGADFLSIDSAHGHSANIIECIKKVKARFQTAVAIAGNIATARAAEELIDAGADALKVGIGPGSICTTRVVAGIRRAPDYCYI